MKFITAAGLTLCLVPSVLSTAIPVRADTSPALDKRVVPLTPPQGTVTCLGYTVAESDILAAINQGTAWATTTPPTQMGKLIIPSNSIPLHHYPSPPPLPSLSLKQPTNRPTNHSKPHNKLTDPPNPAGSSNYPHIYNNYEGLSFPNCAGSTIWEYPVLRYGTNPWVPAKGTKLPTGPNDEREPDRVIFAPASANSVTYCGTITHDPNKLNNKGKLGAFVACTV